jgi:hypothetical protein
VPGTRLINHMSALRIAARTTALTSATPYVHPDGGAGIFHCQVKVAHTVQPTINTYVFFCCARQIEIALAQRYRICAK